MSDRQRPARRQLWGPRKWRQHPSSPPLRPLPPVPAGAPGVGRRKCQRNSRRGLASAIPLSGRGDSPGTRSLPFPPEVIREPIDATAAAAASVTTHAQPPPPRGGGGGGPATGKRLTPAARPPPPARPLGHAAASPQPAQFSGPPGRRVSRPAPRERAETGGGRRRWRRQSRQGVPRRWPAAFPTGGAARGGAAGRGGQALRHRTRAGSCVARWGAGHSHPATVSRRHRRIGCAGGAGVARGGLPPIRQCPRVGATVAPRRAFPSPAFSPPAARATADSARPCAALPFQGREKRCKVCPAPRPPLRPRRYHVTLPPTGGS